MARSAGVVLAGGRSSRMGTPKATLEWHGSTLLRRVVGLVDRTVDGPVAVVRAPGQALPSLPRGVLVVEDDEEGRGPLQGMLAGLTAVADAADVAYVSSTDVPLLHPAFVARMVAAVECGVDIAVPHVGGHRHPLAAVYRTSVVPAVTALVAADRLKPAYLYDTVPTRWMDEPTLLADPRLAKADPALDSLRNLNERDDYDAARSLPPPDVHVERFGTLRLEGPAEMTVRAATLGQAVAAAGLTLDRWLVAAVNGDHVSRDPELPLAAGDVLALMTGDAGG